MRTLACLLLVARLCAACGPGAGGQQEPLAFEPKMVDEAEALWEAVNPVPKGHNECGPDDTPESMTYALTAMAPVTLQSSAQFDEARKLLVNRFRQCQMFIDEHEQPPRDDLEEELHNLLDAGDFYGTRGQAKTEAVKAVMENGEYACYSEAYTHCKKYRNDLCAYVHDRYTWDGDEALEIGERYREHVEQVDKCDSGDFEPVTPALPDVEMPGTNLTPDELSTLVKALDVMESQGHDLGALADNLPASMIEKLGGQAAVDKFLAGRGS